MDHESPSLRSGIPLGDLTNTYRTEGLQKETDSKYRKRTYDKERYATMSREKKVENNRKQRERRRMKKSLAEANQLGQGNAPMDAYNGTVSLHRGQLTENHQQTAGDDVLTNTESNGQSIHESCINANIDVSVSMEGDEDEQWLHRRSLTQEIEQSIDGRVVHVDRDDEMLHLGNKTQDNEPQDGGEIFAGAETNEDSIECTKADGAGGEALINTAGNGEGIHDSCMDSTIPEGGKIKRLMILCVGWCFGSTWFVRFNHSG